MYCIETKIPKISYLPPNNSSFISVIHEKRGGLGGQPLQQTNNSKGGELSVNQALNTLITANEALRNADALCTKANIKTSIGELQKSTKAENVSI